jgi:LmbE family N-acetylglucosaminyl deacetylase
MPSSARPQVCYTPQNPKLDMMADMVDLMIIVPHPDDEVFSTGGILSKMADAGKPTATLTLTKGGSGRTLGLCEPEELPALREKELNASLDVLGVTYRHLLDFPDGSLKDVPPAEIVPEISNRIDALEPKVIVTFPPNGSNGHYDHVTTHQLVSKALEASQHQIERLYYFASDMPYSGAARNNFLPPEEVAAQHLAPTHYLLVGETIENKLRAMGQYETQSRSVTAFMRSIPRRILLESFHRVYPDYPKGQGSRTVSWL